MAENQDNQVLKGDIEKLKEQMSEMLMLKEQMIEMVMLKEQMSEMVMLKDQMVEIMKLLEKRNADDSAGNTENQPTNAPRPHNVGIQHPTINGNNPQGVQWLQYGPPLGYTPPGQTIFEDDTSKSATQVGTMGHNANVGVQHVQNPNSDIAQRGPSMVYLPPPVVDLQTPEFRPRDPTHSHIPNANPTVVPMIHPYYGMRGLPHGYLAENVQPRDKLQMLEERLRAVEGSNIGARDAHDLCLVPNVVIPPKFKVPDFDKYTGATCPASHLTMYCRKMAAFAHDDKLLIHYFQDSLAGAVSSWYMQLERNHIQCWKDLADAFLNQYKYNIDMALDRA